MSNEKLNLKERERILRDNLELEYELLGECNDESDAVDFLINLGALNRDGSKSSNYYGGC